MTVLLRDSFCKLDLLRLAARCPPELIDSTVQYQLARLEMHSDSAQKQHRSNGSRCTGRETGPAPLSSPLADTRSTSAAAASPAGPPSSPSPSPPRVRPARASRYGLVDRRVQQLLHVSSAQRLTEAEMDVELSDWSPERPALPNRAPSSPEWRYRRGGGALSNRRTSRQETTREPQPLADASLTNRILNFICSYPTAVRRGHEPGIVSALEFRVLVL